MEFSSTGILIHSLIFHKGNGKRAVIKFIFQSVKGEAEWIFMQKMYRAEAWDFYNQVIACEIYYFFPREVYIYIYFLTKARWKTTVLKERTSIPISTSSEKREKYGERINFGNA